MAPELITETDYNVSPNLGGKVMKFKFTETETGDWIVFDEAVGAVFINDNTGVQVTSAYATCASIDGATGVLTDSADDDEFVYDSATATQIPETNGYIRIESEIMKYTAGGALTTGTFTGLKRGMFGTTVAAHAQNLDVYVLNTLVIGAAIAGLCRGIADVMEE